MERLYDALDFEDTEDISPLVAWLDSAHFEPFCFVADRQYTEDGDEDDGEELVISWDEIQVNPHAPRKGVHGIRKGSLPKEAFQKLKDNEAFKKAEITEIVPQWLDAFCRLKKIAKP
ncbi:hypothetical protein C0989_003166 [Termitomyces sp. Mn162]|nr:hypothetical protein C0989_003166 [Termitomyces sp. Mn162]